MEELLGFIVVALLEPLLTILGYALLWVLSYVVALPVAYVLLTPFILVAACFGVGKYGQKLAVYYRGVPGAVLHTWGIGPW